MKKNLFLTASFLLVSCFCFSQNVGIGTKSPTEKLNVDSGNIRIGGVNTSWQNAGTSRFLKIGDNDYITLGEEEADDKLTIRAKELFIRPSTTYSTVPVSIQGTTNYSHFFFGSNEDTYIRAGKNNANVIINDIAGGKVGIGLSNPTRAMLEQNGSVSATAAIFGGGGTGISLQQNWPAIGFNSYLDGAGHKSIAQGFGAQLGLSQVNGSLYLVSFPFNGSANTTFSSFTQRFYISRSGKIGIDTDDPLSDITIKVPSQYWLTSNQDRGIRFEYFQSGFPPSSWNVVGDFTLSFVYNGSFVSAINQDGSYGTLSDRRLKNDVQDIDGNCLKKIVALRPVTYFMNTDKLKSHRNYGFIAQEAEVLFPDLIIEKNNLKGITYQYFIPILTKGIQEQQQQIEILQKENADLKTRMERLEKMVLKN